MALQQKSENREQPRKRVLKGGIITFGGRFTTIPCVLRDISSGGARLQVPQSTMVPDSFELIVELDGLEAPCEVTWREPTEVGVSFVDPPKRVAPKRAQIVTVETETSLRRQKTLEESRPESEIEAPAKSSPDVEIPILIADDDPDDRMLLEDAFQESNFNHPLAFVQDGEELLRYLQADEPFQQRKLPGLILLDLNMPKMDGRTALMHLKTNPEMKRIPVIVLTTSDAEEDIQRTYELGVTAFISKPDSYQGLLEIVSSLDQFWTKYVRLPAL